MTSSPPVALVDSFRGTAASASLLLVLLAMLVFATSCATAQPTPQDSIPLGTVLADLTVEPLADLAVSVSPEGQRLLVFTATISNVGQASFELSGTRDRFGWRIRQHVRAQGGEWTHEFRPVMAFGGDGHGHWHIRDAAQYRLVEVGASSEPRYDRKAGFCFFDNQVVQPALATGGATHASNACGGQDATQLTMGLGVGWGDQYQWFLPGQNIDVTDLPDGRYRVEVEVDPERWFAEQRTDNNVTWVVFDLRSDAATGLVEVEVVEVSVRQ